MLTPTALLATTDAALATTLAATAGVAALLLKRVRTLYRKIAPLGALAPTNPATRTLPAHSTTTLANSPLTIGGPNPTGRSTLLLFVSGTCLVSKKMAPIAADFSRSEHLTLHYLGDDTPEAQRAALQTLSIPAENFINDPTIGRTLGVDRVPFAALIDDTGIIIARGLVNSREHLESLLSVQETGHTSIQSYLDANPNALTRA